MTYFPAERVTCPHVIHNISGRQSRLTVLDFGLHVQGKETRNLVTWLAYSSE